MPRVKVLLATLDPLGLPVATDVLSGAFAGDRLYLPAIARVRSSLGQRRLLYVGDCKMGRLATRAGIAFHQDYYLCPLSAIRVPPEVITEYVTAVARGEYTLQKVARPLTDGTQEHLADGFEVTETQTAEHDT